MDMMLETPYSSPVSPVRCPVLSELHLWRVVPSLSSLHKIIRPTAGQSPIVITGTRMSGRKLIMAVWPVKDGEAMTVSVYDPKDVKTLELTVLSGWWTELGLPPLNAMSAEDLDGLAAYVTQSIELQTPEPDHKGRVDMSKASLRYNPGPPPPPFMVFQPRGVGTTRGEEAMSAATAAGRVIWKGLRRFGKRAVLLACARHGPSVILVRGWDTSREWRMSNLVTSHREDWEACAGKNPEFISRTFTAYISSSTGMDDVCSRTESDDENTDLAQVSSGGDRSEVCTTGTQGKHETWRPPPSEEAALDRLGADTLCQTIVNSIKIRQEGRGVRITLRSPRSGRETAGSGWETGLDDNMEETGALDRTFGGDGSGGGGGRPVTVDSDDIDKPTKDAPTKRALLSYEEMEKRVKRLDCIHASTDTGVDDEIAGPRRPLEEINKSNDEPPEVSAGHKIARTFTRRRGADGKMRSIEEIVEQLRQEVKVQEEMEAVRRHKAVLQWKRLGKSLCRLLRMSDYWYGFIADDTLSSEERASRRIAVLQQMVEIRINVNGASTMRTLVRTFAVYKHHIFQNNGLGSGWMLISSAMIAFLAVCIAPFMTTKETYPRAIWARFRQLMRQPKAMRCRRDMSVCAMLLSDGDNPFFRQTMARVPFCLLVDLATDSRLVEKPTLSVVYEEGETASKVIGGELPGSQLISGSSSAATEKVGHKDATTAGVAKLGTVGGERLQSQRVRQNDTNSTRTIGSGNRPGATIGSGGSREGMGDRADDGTKQVQRAIAGVANDEEQRWIVGAYVIMRGSVDLYVLERGEAAGIPTVASQDDLAMKASRGQPMYHPLPPAEWEAAMSVSDIHSDMSQSFTDEDHRMLERRQRRAIAEIADLELWGNGAGPRRARTRNVAPRWRACRLGCGALFGDRTCYTRQARSARNTAGVANEGPKEKEEPRQVDVSGPVPALETAVTTERAELLEIGMNTYRQVLEELVRDRSDRSVAVLRATGAMDGVPTAALKRICRYATDRTAGAPATHAACNLPFIPTNPGPAPSPTSTSARGMRDHNGRHRPPPAICRQGTLRTTAFFVVDGDGQVVLNEPSPTGCFSDGRDDTTDGRLCVDDLRRRRRQRRLSEGDASSVKNGPGCIAVNRDVDRDKVVPSRGEVLHECRKSVPGASDLSQGEDCTCTFAGSLPRLSAVTPELLPLEPTCGGTAAVAERATRRDDAKVVENDQESVCLGDFTGATGADATVTDRSNQPFTMSTPPMSHPLTSSESWGVTIRGETWLEGQTVGPPPDKGAATAAAILTRGDFFGLVPAAHEAAHGLSDEEGGSMRTEPHAEHAGAMRHMHALPLSVSSSGREKQFDFAGNGSILHPSAAEEATVDPRPFSPLALRFPGLHKASFIAGPNGVRCMAIALTVLRKICFPVYQRLERAAEARYSEWMAEAALRDEDEWNERLESGSVDSLTQNFYRSFAEGGCSKNIDDKRARRDVDSSIGDLSFSGDRANVSENGRSHHTDSGGDGGVADVSDSGRIQCRPAVPTGAETSGYLIPPSRSLTSRKTFFDLGRRFRRLLSCSSSETVIPVRLGNSLPTRAICDRRHHHRGRKHRPRQVSDASVKRTVRATATAVATSSGAADASQPSTASIRAHERADVPEMPEPHAPESPQPCATDVINGIKNHLSPPIALASDGRPGDRDTAARHPGSPSGASPPLMNKPDFKDENAALRGGFDLGSVSSLGFGGDDGCEKAAGRTYGRGDFNTDTVDRDTRDRGRREETSQSQGDSRSIAAGKRAGAKKRLRMEQQAQRQRQREPWDYPVSPFSPQPCWASLPPTGVLRSSPEATLEHCRAKVKCGDKINTDAALASPAEVMPDTASRIGLSSPPQLPLSSPSHVRSSHPTEKSGAPQHDQSVSNGRKAVPPTWRKNSFSWRVRGSRSRKRQRGGGHRTHLPLSTSRKALGDIGGANRVMPPVL